MFPSQLRAHRICGLSIDSGRLTRDGSGYSECAAFVMTPTVNGASCRDGAGVTVSSTDALETMPPDHGGRTRHYNWGPRWIDRKTVAELAEPRYPPAVRFAAGVQGASVEEAPADGDEIDPCLLYTSDAADE